MTIDSFNDVIRYLNGTFTIKPHTEKLQDPLLHIEREKYLLSLFNHPEESFNIIHVAGSKGKGTTSAYIAGLLRNGMNKIGLYLSPHVFSYKERWSFVSTFSRGIQYFDDKVYIKCAREMEKVLQDYTHLTNFPLDIPPTPFELYTLFAALLFREENIKLAVFETGIGGRCDATNVFNPIASVITHIEKEHTEILGSSIEEITKEKCGIIKKGVPVFAFEQDEKIMSIIKEVVNEKKANLISVKPGSKKLRSLFRTSLMQGEYAFDDFELANVVVSNIKENLTIPPIDDIVLPARGQVFIDENCVFILDGAHTKDSLQNAVESIPLILKNASFSAYTKDKELSQKSLNKLEIIFEKIPSMAKKCKTVIFATSKNKDVDGMAEVLVQSFENICVTSLEDITKTRPITDILIALEKALNKTPCVKTKEIYIANNLYSAIKKVRENIDIDTLIPIAIFGSFYLCGELLNDNIEIYISDKDDEIGDDEKEEE